MTDAPQSENRVDTISARERAAIANKCDDAAQVEQRLSELNSLLCHLETVTAANHTLPPVISKYADNQLIQVRLGIAGSLYTALECKHAATAGHSLRVALTCSCWAAHMQMDESQRDAIEVAALLHDIGMIGAPDQILLKPAKLNEEETALILLARKASADILRYSCNTPDVLGIVENVSAWFDGTREGFLPIGEKIPLGARMIAIAEAFDSMTTDLVYRPACSNELALAELFECAGTQFDPKLVRGFSEFLQENNSFLYKDVAQRWLGRLACKQVDSAWTSHLDRTPSDHADGMLFESKLLQNMYDAVVFIDTAERIVLWNRGAERLTGIASSGVCGQLWKPELLQICDEKGRSIDEVDCPLKMVLKSGVQMLRRSTITGRGGRRVAVDAHVIPVTKNDGIMLGAIIIFHDASSESTLEQRCLNLYDKATKDHLTQVANRAEFDRVHEMFVEMHQQRQMPCSLIICDLDRFKLVNDTHGHQAGDAVIKSFAGILKSSCRPGDLVARYGGEEFVLLCVDCDNAAATKRAEQIRATLYNMPQMKMGNRIVTASFGVTEIQPGDTPETMLRRADRALLRAKSTGRNCVVQLGAGSTANKNGKKPKLSRRKGDSSENNYLLAKRLISSAPAKMTVDKLRGFIADHNAKIDYVKGNL
ncbi:MAG: diguanylate cyclase domain-containing protein, partial [Thermoguttaceae bacterium]